MEIQESGAMFDVVLIGGGASGLYTLLNLAQRLASTDALRERARAGRWRIGLVERSPDGLGGVPYTRRSCYTSLLITSLRDFLPDAERDLFINWLDENKDHIFDLHARCGGALSARWAQTHLQEIATGAWEHLYLPRYLFGMYMDERAHRAIKSTEPYCDVKLFQAEVTDVIREEDGFKIDLANAGSLKAATVVLAIGSTPNQAKLIPPSGASADVCLINDPYDPGLDLSLERIDTLLRGYLGTSLNVLIIGAAASTMDILYTLTDRWNDPRPIRFSILSPNGKLPDRIEHSSSADNFLPLALQALQLESEVTAKEIYHAAERDIALGKSQGLTTSDTLAPISEAVLALVKRLSPSEKWEFSTVWGTALGRLQRRSGPEYSNVAVELAAQGRLSVIEGRFRQIAEADSTGALVEIDSRGEVRILSNRFQVVVNCAGFAKISELPADHLLRRLLDRGLVRQSAAPTGLLVNDQMEASPGLFVLGPLLAGNVVNGTAIWHVEHCGRISRFASELADILRDRLARCCPGPQPACTSERRECDPFGSGAERAQGVLFA